MRVSFIGVVVLAFIFVGVAAGQTRQGEDGLSQAELRRKLLTRVFGDAVKLDAEMVERVREAEHGKRHYRDTDGDGRSDEAWFIDIDPRHRDVHRPLLVRAIDEDGDLREGGEPDLESDLYIADWKADGVVDVVADYTDTDGDQDLDEMGLYFLQHFYGGESLRVWWGRDDGDDNLLWWDQGYRYYQRPGQARTHFNGDETFYQFYLPLGAERWSSHFENPFAFYDHDSDGVAEEVIRIQGDGDKVHSLRWSFDADNDATAERQRDYDVSISSFAPGWTPAEHMDSDFTLSFNEHYSETVALRGIESQPVLKRDSVAAFVRPVTWARTLLTWDENDHNVGWGGSRPIERWEGVILHSREYKGDVMHSLGGPTAGPFNKRNELVVKPEGPNAFYYNPADQRVHLRHADRAWIDVDFDGDKESDMLYDLADTDGDGYIDRMSLDMDGDGEPEDAWPISTRNVRDIEYIWGAVHSAHAGRLDSYPPKLYRLNDALTQALESLEAGAGEDAAARLLNERFRNEHLGRFSDKFISSNETVMYYLKLARDRRIARLKGLVGEGADFLDAFTEARSRGDVAGMIEALGSRFDIAEPERSYETWLADLWGDTQDRQRVAWNDAWLPPNVGWESRRAAFRIYDGHIDVFGKRERGLIYPRIEDLPGSYHEDGGGWGMDILHVGETGGLGGVTLYVNGEAYPMYTDGREPEPAFTTRVVSESEERVEIEARAEGVGPEGAYTVSIRPSAVAGRADSPVTVLVEGGRKGDRVEIGVGITMLPAEQAFLLDTQAGVMANWGSEEPRIGRVGLGVIFPADRYRRVERAGENDGGGAHVGGEHRVVLGAEVGEPLTYHIQARWLRGMQYPRTPSAADWLQTLRAKAATLRGRGSEE